MRWLTDAMATVASETFTSTSAPIQYAAVAAFKENPEIDRYVEKCRNVLATLADEITGQLQKTAVDVLPAQGGFYIFPDFSSYRTKLAEKNILNSAQLCDGILQDTGVAILPGSDFGRDPEELTARLAFVDFDGGKALQQYPEDGVLNREYLLNCCGRTVEAVERLVNWLDAL